MNAVIKEEFGFIGSSPVGANLIDGPISGPERRQDGQQQVLPVRARGLLSGAAVRSGYVPGNEALDQVLNRSMAVVFLILTAPLFLFVLILQKLFAPGDVFYRGQRLGKDREIFYILKFRTLVPDANRLTRLRTLPRRSNLETRIGAYLRRSRLDELPQLINILRGEMVFFGPRPIRPEMECVYRAEAPSYEERFKVRPGLVGLAQAVMSHETPKAVRARLNKQACNAPIRYGALWLFVGYVGWCVLAKSARLGACAVLNLFRPMAEHGWLQSGFVRPRHSRIEICVEDGIQMGAITGMSDEVLQFVASKPLPRGHHQVTLIARKSGGHCVRRSVAIDVREILPVGQGKCGLLHYAVFEAKTASAIYFIERYFLRATVVPAC